VYRALAEHHGNVLAVYTAHHSSWVRNSYRICACNNLHVLFLTEVIVILATGNEISVLLFIINNDLPHV
jgi:hypothetical protein